jgi:epoxyqueuosine reductase
MTADQQLRHRLQAEAETLGFAAVGIARADAAPRAGERLRAWIAEGCHGDMLWMADTAERRASPQGLWPEVRSVIMLGLPYTPSVDPLRNADRPELGTISVYALGQDYHDLIKRRLKQLAGWLVAAAGGDVKVFVDTAPVLEKPLAEAAGLGWQGKHTNLVSRDHGSWLFLGAIYTTLDFGLDLAPGDRKLPTCGSCDACQTACPTDAFPAPYRLDARRCISYLTIENKGPIPHAFRKAIGNRIYGCDDCLAACPWNKFAVAARELAFQPRAELVAPPLADLLALDDAGFRQVFAGSPIKRIGRNRLVRNALIAAGNSGDASLTAQVEALRGDADEVVREAADWAADQLLSAKRPTQAAVSAGWPALSRAST